MKINYKYSRNNAQFLYDLSSTSSIDQLVRRLTGRQTVTNEDGEKEHVDPAFNVDEILINGVEVFNRLEQETVYNNIDKLRAPWDDTENKELSAEDARKRNEDLTKAASLLKTYNDRFTELEKRLSLLPAEVRKIPNEFMSIGVNGFYRTISISLGLNEYLDEISTDKEAFKIFNTAEEQNDALNNVMDVIDFLSKLDESAQELFNSDDQEAEPTDDLKEAPNGDQLDAPTNDDVKDAPNGDQQDDTEKASDGDQLDAPTDDKEASTKGQQGDAAKADKETSNEGQQNDTVEGDKEASNDDQKDADKEVPADGQHDAEKEASTADNAEGQANTTDAGEGQQDVPAANTAKAGESHQALPAVKGQQEADKPKLTGVAAIENQLLPGFSEFLTGND